MKIELKEFQEEAVRQLYDEVRTAREEIQKRGREQAVVFSSPTGSGKTVMATALIERLWKGWESEPEDEHAVFLWLSDMPELNNQTCEKIEAQSSEFDVLHLEIIQNTFDAEQFTPGRIYFLNTQKLAKDTLLTSKVGDKRRFTIWQTIENTAKAKPTSFYLFIDEAHRGMGESARERATAETIVQRFIKGDAGCGLSPIKLVVGISATPQRFINVLGSRSTRHCPVEANAVRASGLLKERISLFCQHETTKTVNDFDLLAEAARRWKRFRDEWYGYGQANAGTVVDPVLVIQVEDGNDTLVTKTDLDTVVQVLEREMGAFQPGELAHCFDKETPIPAGNRILRKIEPTQIQAMRDVRVVFFKMALTTGWDCPRAEVMMSFRKACDHTLIAQLVGRMVRTPLARRIEGRDLLNTVSLFLPHYDQEGIKAILEDLNDPEKGTPTTVENGRQLVPYRRNQNFTECFELLKMLPTYQVDRLPSLSEVQRLVRLGRRLTNDRVDSGAWAAAKRKVLDALTEERNRLAYEPAFREKLEKVAELELREVSVTCGVWNEFSSNGSVRIPKTPETIQAQFDLCGRMLGEGLHEEFWHHILDADDPDTSKLEIVLILHEEVVWGALKSACGQTLAAWWKKHGKAINELPESKRDEYDRLRRRAKDPQSLTRMPPQSLELIKDCKAQEWKLHLYEDADGLFAWDANEWESTTLETAMAESGFVGWLRNLPRRPESLCVPYHTGGDDKPCFPDLLVFRRDQTGRLLVDMLDPHNVGLPDAADKAVGLAEYAHKHGEHFDKIQMIIKDNGKLLRLDLNQESIRSKVKSVRDSAHLLELFREHG